MFDKYPSFELEINTLIVLHTVIFGPPVRFLTVVFTGMCTVYFIFFFLWFLLSRKFNRFAFIANRRETLPNVLNQRTSIEIKRFFPALNQYWSCCLCCNDITIIIGRHNNKNEQLYNTRNGRRACMFHIKTEIITVGGIKYR